MSASIMVLPAHDSANIELVRIAQDFQAPEAFSHLTGLIAAAARGYSNFAITHIPAQFEHHGVDSLALVVGPETD